MVCIWLGLPGAPWGHHLPQPSPRPQGSLWLLCVHVALPLPRSLKGFTRKLRGHWKWEEGTQDPGPLPEESEGTGPTPHVSGALHRAGKEPCPARLPRGLSPKLWPACHLLPRVALSLEQEATPIVDISMGLTKEVSGQNGHQRASAAGSLLGYLSPLDSSGPLGAEEALPTHSRPTST